MNSLYESGYLQYLLILNLLTLVFIIKSYGKGLSRKELSRKAFKYLLFFFVFHIVDTLFIAMTMRMDHDHFYNRVDYTTPIDRDYLKFKENLYFGYCNIRMGLLSNLSCRPYYLFRNWKRSHHFDAPMDFNRKTNKMRSKNFIDKYDQRSDEMIKSCIKDRSFLTNDCIKANTFQYSRNPERGKDITREVLKELGPDLENMNCSDFFKVSIEYELYNFDLNELLALENIGGTKKDQWIKNLNIDKCFTEKCENVCSEHYRYYWDSTPRDRFQRLIFIILFIEEYPLHKDATYLHGRSDYIISKLKDELKFKDFDSFHKTLIEHYPKHLLKIGIDRRNDKKLWLRIFHTN